MNLNNHKELDPVYYGYSGAILRNNFIRAPFDRCFHYHWHERMELILVHEGSIKVDFGTKEIIIEENSVIIIPPFRLHGGFACEKGAVFQTAMFDIATFFNKTPASKNLLEPIVNLKINFDFYSKNQELIQALNELFSFRNKSNDENALFIASCIYKILGLLHKYCIVTADAHLSQNNEKKLNDILTYIDNNLDTDITPNSLAKKFGYSNEYLCRKFKATTGFTPSNYIKLMRLEKSKRLLEKTDEKIGNIATQCGFPDFSYFCRCFKSTYNMTPGEYISLQHKSTSSP